MRNASHYARFTAALLATALTACSGGGGAPPPASSPDSFTAPLKGVDVTAHYNHTPLAGINVEMYVGKEVESCPPFSQPCVKQVKGLDAGTTGSDGTVLLKGRFSSLEIVCVQAYNPKKYTTLQECNKNFPSSVKLQFNI